MNRLHSTKSNTELNPALNSMYYTNIIDYVTYCSMSTGQTIQLKYLAVLPFPAGVSQLVWLRPGAICSSLISCWTSAAISVESPNWLHPHTKTGSMLINHKRAEFDYLILILTRELNIFFLCCHWWYTDEASGWQTAWIQQACSVY